MARITTFGFGKRPHNPLKDKYAPLEPEGIHPYCALMQVAADDTHADYLVCRGYDTREKRYYDYDTEDDDKNGIPVAKPYGNRVVDAYEVGQVFAAFLPYFELGQNPGVASESQGHPSDLDEELEILYDDNGTVINWMILDSGSTPEGSSGSVSGSGKDTAIVPASWTKGGYAALFAEESPEVVFHDKIIIETVNASQRVPIDHRFMEVCETETIEVEAVTCDRPIAVGATIFGSNVHLFFPWSLLSRRVRIVVTLAGTRKGFKNVRFPGKTHADFKANEEWLKRGLP